MKKTHIILLVLIAAAITILISYSGNLTTYETVASAKQKPNKSVKLVAKLVKNTLQYDAIKNPNYLTFTAIDTLGNTVDVVYHDTKPTDMEKSDRLVLGGKMVDNKFECKTILLKCPSKYKDDKNALKEGL